MIYEDLVSDFADRTRRNLEVIDRLKDDPESDVFEVTQLINSMLGLLVFPRENFLDRIPEIPLAELKQRGWPQIREITTEESFDPPENLRELVRYLRNSIAHLNIEFRPENGVIRGITVWKMKRGKKNWKASLNLEELREFTLKFVELLKDEELIRGAQ